MKNLLIIDYEKYICDDNVICRIFKYKYKNSPMRKWTMIAKHNHHKKIKPQI